MSLPISVIAAYVNRHRVMLMKRASRLANILRPAGGQARWVFEGLKLLAVLFASRRLEGDTVQTGGRSLCMSPAAGEVVCRKLCS